MPRKKLDTTPLVNTAMTLKDLTTTLHSLDTQIADGAFLDTAGPATIAVHPATWSETHGGLVTFTVGNLPLKVLSTLLDTLPKK